jgi:superfamily II DNA/RNA helicase
VQVAAVFQPLCQAVGLDVAVASGKGPLSGEVAALVQTHGSRTSSCVDVLVVTPGRCCPPQAPCLRVC